MNEQSCNEDIATRITQKQINLIYQNQPVALFATFLVVAFVFGFLYSSDIIYNLAVCFSLFVFVILFRFYINWSYHKARKNNDINYHLFGRLYFFGVIFSGMVWAVTTLFLFPVVDLNGQITLLIIVMGFAAASHTTMGFLKAPVIIFILLLMLPLMYATYHSDLPNAAAMLVVMVVYMAFLLRSSWLFYKSTYDMLHLNEIAILREHKLMLQTAKAKSASEEKSKFLSRMSHELRTPLNAILGMNELLLCDKKEPLTKKQRERSKKAGEAGKHLLAIVNDILDLSRVETGKVELVIALTNCHDVIRDSIKLVEDKAEQRNIAISCNAEPADVFVMADSKRLKQIIVNLLDNAVKYNKQGGQVSVKLHVENTATVRISITDTGYGIAKDDIKKLFLPFSRVASAGSGIDGTGIGLNLCKQFIELMHGRMGVDCHQGEGCCFWIELSYVESVIDTDAKETEDQNIVISNMGKQKVLLVEDNLVNCEVALDMLEEFGLETDVAYDGRQAVAAAKANQYALILMDCEMPVLDGFAATELIRSDEKRLQKTSTPIIALTAHAISGAREKCITSGMDDFLSKPFSLFSLQLIVNKWLLIRSIVPKTTFSSNKTRHISQDNVSVLNQQSSDLDLLDQNVLHRLHNKKKKNGSSLAEKVINIYLEQSPRLLAKLITATQKEDVDAIKGISHTLKSSSINVGAIRLSDLCEKLEHSCGQGHIETVVVENVHKTYSDVAAALNRVLKGYNEVS